MQTIHHEGVTMLNHGLTDVEWVGRRYQIFTRYHYSAHCEAAHCVIILLQAHQEGSRDWPRYSERRGERGLLNTDLGLQRL